MSKGHFKASTMMAAALVLVVVGPMASAIVLNAGIYSLGYGSVSWPSKEAGAGEGIIQLSKSFGNYDSIASSTVPTVSVVQLGNYSLNASQALSSGAVQLSGYYGNMGNYRNIFFRPMLGSGVGSGGGGCCGC